MRTVASHCKARPHAITTSALLSMAQERFSNAQNWPAVLPHPTPTLMPCCCRTDREAPALARLSTLILYVRKYATSELWKVCRLAARAEDGVVDAVGTVQRRALHTACCHAVPRCVISCCLFCATSARQAPLQWERIGVTCFWLCLGGAAMTQMPGAVMPRWWITLDQGGLRWSEADCSKYGERQL